MQLTQKKTPWRWRGSRFTEGCCSPSTLTFVSSPPLYQGLGMPHGFSSWDWPLIAPQIANARNIKISVTGEIALADELETSQGTGILPQPRTCSVFMGKSLPLPMLWGPLWQREGGWTQGLLNFLPSLILKRHSEIWLQRQQKQKFQSGYRWNILGSKSINGHKHFKQWILSLTKCET